MKIDRVEAFPLRYPTTGFFKFFAGARGAAGRAAVIVKVTADDGTVGWGQSVPVEKWSDETLEASTIAIRDYYAPALIGHDPLDIAGAHRIMDQTIHGGIQYRHADHARRHRHCAARSDRQTVGTVAERNVEPSARRAADT